MTTIPTSLMKVLRMLDKHGPVTVERAAALLAGSKNLEADLRRLVDLGSAEAFTLRAPKGDVTAYRIVTAARVELRTYQRTGIGAIPESRPAASRAPMPVLDAPEAVYRPPAHCYQGTELSHRVVRPGAYDNEALPSRISSARHYRDGRVVPALDSQE